LRIAGGDVPYRDFAVEYPPGPLVTFLGASYNLGFPGETAHPVWAPRLNPDARRFARSFAIEMITLIAISIVLTAMSLRMLQASALHVVAALGLLAVSPLLLGDLVFTRFDALPAALTAAAIAGLLRQRFRLAGLSLGLGVATKLYPVLLLPLAATFAWKQRGRSGAAAVVGGAVGGAFVVFLPFLIAAPRATLWPVHAQLTRGLEIESLGSSVVVTLNLVTRHLIAHGWGVPAIPAPIAYEGHGLNDWILVGTAGHIAGLASGVLTGFILLVIWVRFARSPGSEKLLVQYVAAAITAQIALGRVLSPQFLIWLLPLVPLVGNRRGRLAFVFLVGAVALTHLWFPGHFRLFFAEPPGATALLLLRNLVLVALLLTLLMWRSGLSISRRGGTSPGRSGQPSC
jgi:hypothetical protein